MAIWHAGNIGSNTFRSSLQRHIHLDLHRVAFRSHRRSFVQGLSAIGKFATTRLWLTVPQIIKTLGCSKLMTFLIQAPPFIFAYLLTCVVSWSLGRYMEHCWDIVGTAVGCMIGTIIVISTYSPGPRYFGIFLMCSGPFVSLNVSWVYDRYASRLTFLQIHIPWETTNVARPRKKRAALLAITNCISSVSHWFSPYFFSSTSIINRKCPD